MQVYDYQVSDVDQLLAGPPLEGKYVQLSVGDLGLWTREFVTDDLRVRLMCIEQTVHLREALVGDDFFFAAILHTKQPLIYNDRELVVGNGVEFTVGEEINVIWPGGTVLFDVQAKPAFAAKHGWKVGRGHTHIPSAELKHLSAQMLGQLTQSPATDEVGEPCAGPCEERIVQTVTNLLDAGFILPVEGGYRNPPEHRLVQEALKLTDRMQNLQELNVGQLAERLGVSERTMYYAFSNQLGISPYQYMLLRRLSQIRTRLLKEEKRPGIITRVATEAGFDHFGRMSKMYRRHFGETPTQTLRRVNM